ncbi:ABC transporter substrate-binding protein [Roseomonas hellenica]|uniref:ABC transporter substrate-binding protein n=1 Tax=Plastoroseomonas hellenica TaxID=2687306 RepID=A0ABS5F632_9PROT|nr:ABC transporter substrate-binding protein [Plastoroseomonas hellenica]MBR0668007.1 ABC transporter substrate-binding protein [Plastoroseomonas hellenica]
MPCRPGCVALLTMLVLAMLAAPTAAQTLRIGMKAAVDGSDPHQSYSPNRNVQMQVYESLIFQDETLRPIPGLAESWRLVDDNTWEFRLRDGVRFHDGTLLTIADIAFSLRRAQAATGLRTYGPALRAITGVETVDARTLLIRTASPTPMITAYLTSLMIVSANAAADAGEEDFNGGRAAIGTGPYRWARFNQGSDVVLERAPHHWAPAEPWQRVIYRFIPNDSARVAALLAGDVEVIDAVPPALYARIRADARSRLVTATSAFNNYMFIDSHRDPSPFVTGADGQPLVPNPLRDRRVRQALSLALNRVALAERAMEGGAEPSGQIAPPGFIGHDPDRPLPAYDPARARALLAEAGYPQGFNLTIHCTSNRFAGDARTCQAIGQMLAAVGIRTQVEALPTAVFFRRAAFGGPDRVPEFSVSLSMFATTTGVATEGMNSLLRSWNPALGHGASNRGRYSDAALDALLATAETELDDRRRDAATLGAVRRAMDEAAIVPVFFVQSAWGMTRGLTLVPRGDQYTMATGIRRAPQ